MHWGPRGWLPCPGPSQLTSTAVGGVARARPGDARSCLSTPTFLWLLFPWFSLQALVCGEVSGPAGVGDKGQSGVLRGWAAALATSPLPAHAPCSLLAPSVCLERAGPPGSEPAHGQLTWAVLPCSWAQGRCVAALHQGCLGDLVPPRAPIWRAPSRPVAPRGSGSACRGGGKWAPGGSGSARRGGGQWAPESQAVPAKAAALWPPAHSVPSCPVHPHRLAAQSGAPRGLRPHGSRGLPVAPGAPLWAWPTPPCSRPPGPRGRLVPCRAVLCSRSGVTAGDDPWLWCSRGSEPQAPPRPL